MRVRLASPTDLAGFRSEARRLLAHGVPPAEVQWGTPDEDADLFAREDEPPEPPVQPPQQVQVPADFVALCGQVVLHRDPQRFALLYRMLWRLVHEPALRHDPLDPDALQLRQMAKSVARDSHKMHAFVRFRPVDDGHAEPLHVAWFEPEHHIVEANADWFRRRFTNMRWAILTPERCVEWDLRALHLRPGASRDAAPPADAGEQLWLTYYRSIFNPARLKLATMRREMPRRYWRNLPEAALIAPLAAQAQERSGRMIEAGPTRPARRLVRIAPAPVAQAPAGSLAALRTGVEACRACPLGAAATQGVCGEGPLRPDLMIVGEQPGDQEDLHGRPFVGPAGQLLDRALAEAGIAREAAFLTNVVRHFGHELRGKRRIHKTPGQRELLACAHWLQQEVALVQPRRLVALGGTAARALLGREVAVLRERGSWCMAPDGRQVLLTVHPSSILRLPRDAQPQAFAAFVADLRLAG